MQKKLHMKWLLTAFLVITFVSTGLLGVSVAATTDEATIAAEFVESQIGVNRMMGNVLDAGKINKILKESPNDIAVLDLRSPSEFAAGHIKGAVNISQSELLSYYGKSNLMNVKYVVLASDSGQLGRYAQGMMWLVGCKNVYLMKWGMSSWNSKIADKHWIAAVGNRFASQFTKEPAPKNTARSLPILNTGETEPENILWTRVETLLTNDDFSKDALVQPKEVFANLDDYYIINYWPLKAYSQGHIPSATQYAIKPVSELGLNRALNTLPTDKKIAIYCFTGQTSALMTAYLRVLGYDAYSIAYGVNAMNYDMLKNNMFEKKFIGNFQLEKAAKKAGKKPKYGPKGPVNSVDGVLYPKGQLGIIFKSVTFDKATRYEGNDEVTVPPNNPTSKDIWAHNLVIRYGLMENLELRGKITYKKMDLQREAPATAPDFSNLGLADSVIRARYQILSQRDKDPIFLWAGVGLNIPTGDTKEKTNGVYNPMSWQMGDGSWDPIIDIAITKQIKKLKLSTYTSYTFNQEGDRDWKWGDVFKFDVSTVYALNPWFSVEAELNYINTAKPENNGVKVDTIGGSQLFFTPGIHMMLPGTKHHLALGVPITIYRDLNGDTQLSEDYCVVLKAAFAF